MHSSGVLSSLLLLAGVALAAPAANYTPDSPYRAPNTTSSSSVASHKPTVASEPPYSAYTPDAPYKPNYTPDSPYTPPAKTATPAAPPKSTPSSYNGGKPGKDTGKDVNYEADLPPIVPVNTRSGDRDLISKLMTAPTQQERVRLLNQPGDFVFDFNESPEGSESVGKGGHTTAANARTFPALIGNGAAMTLGFLGPCGMNTAHVHPRGTELNIVVEGRLVTNFIVENGLPAIANTLGKYQMTVFPQGALHQEFNPDCTDAVFVAGFNSVDPGVEQAAQSFFGLRPDVVSSTLGGVYTINGADLESFRDHIPANVALGVDACLKKCGIQRNAKRDISEILNL